jgi:hypothetical protein
VILGYHEARFKVVKTKTAATFLLLGLQAVLLGGRPAALWEDGRFARYHGPPPPPQARLYFSPERKDFLVRYEEWGEDSDALRHRAFWLAQNQARLMRRAKPHFVRDRSPAGLVPVPVYQGCPAGDGEPPPVYALVSTNAYALTICCADTNLVPASLSDHGDSTHRLPVYRDASGRVKKVLLTPFALTADATVVGGVIFIWAYPGSAEAVRVLVR